MIAQSCPSCVGAGGFPCGPCGEDGTLVCPLCEGETEVSCVPCAGRGQIWTWDYYAVSPAQNPRGPESGSKRMVRGGAWSSDAETCRLSHRQEALPSEAQVVRGFRVVRSLKP